MEDRTPVARTVHLVLPWTGRPLCGYEEEGPGAKATVAIPCPECSALLRSGVVARRSSVRSEG